jgi:hypothetical protein
MIWLLQLKQLVAFTVIVMLMVPLQVYAGYRFIDYLAEMHVKQKYRK